MRAQKKARAKVAPTPAAHMCAAPDCKHYGFFSFDHSKTFWCVNHTGIGREQAGMEP